jgi:hypothetical protein
VITSNLTRIKFIDYYETITVKFTLEQTMKSPEEEE